MPDGKIIHVICNTHWDREWVYPFRETQLLLVEFMDHLLDLLEQRPDYHSFLMDAQTLCVEDYLELRPENRERIVKQVRAGRLLIGPWYSLPEEYIVNGESLVRNLVVGHRVAEALGGPMKLGYTPFSYGQTSQMPQIYHGFGIDTIVFYRGINTPHSEFVMEGPDGSRLLGCRFGALSRFSFYFYIYRMVRYDKTRDDWRYEWDRGALPFRLCNEQHPRAHYYVVDPERKLDLREYIPEQVQKLVRDESQHFTTRHIASMQGFDSSEPDPVEIDLIAECQAHLPNDTIKQSSLLEYFAGMRQEVKHPFVIHGESRDPGATGKWTHLFGDVIESRTRTKRANAHAETLLQRKAEPFAALAWTLGAEYLKPAFDIAWRYLLHNHPHDTICGAGVDQMEKDMGHRFDQCRIMSEGLMRRGLQHLQRRINNDDIDVSEAVLTVFNPSPFPRSEVVTVLLDLPDESGYEGFAIVDPQGHEAPWQEVARWPQGTLVRNLQDISLEQRATRIRLHLWAKQVPALGYKTYHLQRRSSEHRAPGSLVVAHNLMENEHLQVRVNDNGTLSVTDKRTGHTYHGLHYFEDGGEVGHSWVHMAPAHDELITSHGAPVEVALEQEGALLARYRVRVRMEIPAGIETRDDGAHRAAERKPLVIESWITLRRGARAVDIVTRFDNQCRNHRLRAVFPTGVAAKVSAAEAAFDVIERPIDRTPDSLYYERDNPIYPNHRFVDVSDGEVGVAIINDGLRSFEAIDRPERAVAITLMRGFVFCQSPVIDRWDVYPEMTLAQSLGEHEFRYAIYPHAGTWEHAGVYREAESHSLPLEVAQAGKHGGDLPKELSLLTIEPEAVALSALKRAEDRETLVARIYNPTAHDVTATLAAYKPIASAALLNLNEEVQEHLTPDGSKLSLPLKAKQIATVEFTL
ncbi:MAG TPA: glycoside hydrolase family 38 C-terminal domain-containing protein [Armatimonadota bacterium]|nr:glycoside hydrolase family 38 C-terminal domain-containing protein [Armatimonadota bacterium]